MRVCVVYARPDAVWERFVEVEPGEAIRVAIERSGIEATLGLRGTLSVGVFGRLRSLDDPLRDGDRVEIYRPLQVDPKEARRIRADLRRRAGQRRTGG